MNTDNKSNCMRKTFSKNFQYDENIVIKHSQRLENISKKNEQKKDVVTKPLLQEFKSEIDENPFFFS